MQTKFYHPFVLLVALTTGFISTPGYSSLGISVASGYGVRGIIPYRAAISWDFGPLVCKECSWGLVGIWETSGAYWNGKHGPNRTNDRLSIFTTGPVLRWSQLKPSKIGILPYFEAGLGASWLSRHEIGGRRLSTHFQFEDNIGVGFRFGRNYQYDLTYRLFHYSNASIKRPNSGVNMMMLNFGIWFS